MLVIPSLLYLIYLHDQPKLFPAMQVKQEELIPSTTPLSCKEIHTSSPFPPQEMQYTDKNPSYSLWSDYFDNFPVLTEFDLRPATTAGSTGSSIASASSSEWSSPSSGSPVSDFGAEDSPFDDNSVPTSIIDDIVQTLKMDGYNFDHLGEEMMDNNNNQNNPVIKQELELTISPCYMQTPVYTSLNPPKLQQMPDTRKYSQMSNSMHSPPLSCSGLSEITSFYDQGDQKQGVWCNNTTPLPPLSLPPPAVTQHLSMIPQHSQQNPHAVQHQHMAVQPLPNSPQQLQRHESISSMSSYGTSPVDVPAGPFAMPSFSHTFNLDDQSNMHTYKYIGQPTFSPPNPAELQPIQTSEKSTETKPRRRRSNNGGRIEKPHICKECGAAFKLSANLKQHQVIHTGEKPFSCEICKAMFTRLSSLKTHHRLHTGEKPHICPYCSAAFADRSAMKAHKRIHTGERPYKCQVCSTSFTQLSHLNAHKRTHTGEKPYACGICGTTFKQLGHLKRHEKSHVCSRS